MNDSHYTSLVQAKKVMEILLRPEIKKKKKQQVKSVSIIGNFNI